MHVIWLSKEAVNNHFSHDVDVRPFRGLGILKPNRGERVNT